MRKLLLVLRSQCATRVHASFAFSEHTAAQPASHTHSSYDSIRDVSAVIPVHKRGDGIGAPSATSARATVERHNDDDDGSMRRESHSVAQKHSADTQK